MSDYKTGYNVQSSPIVDSHIEMKRAELERFCNERNLPLFYLKVEETVALGIAQSCKPFMKYFAIYEGQWIIAYEKIETEEKEGAQ